MDKQQIKYIIVNEEGHESYPIEHNTLLVPRINEKFKDEQGMYIVEDVIHEGLFSDPGIHTVTVKLKKL